MTQRFPFTGYNPKTQTKTQRCDPTSHCSQTKQRRTSDFYHPMYLHPTPLRLVGQGPHLCHAEARLCLRQSQGKKGKRGGIWRRKNVSALTIFAASNLCSGFPWGKQERPFCLVEFYGEPLPNGEKGRLWATGYDYRGVLRGGRGC